MDFNRIYAENVAWVRRALTRGGVRPANLDDVTQEVFLAVHRSYATYSGEVPIKRWIAGVTWRVRCVHFRGMRANAHHQDIEGIELSGGSLPDEDLAEARHRANVKADVDRVMGRLSSRQRTALELYHVSELSASQVAKDMETSENAVRMLIRAATRNVKEAFAS